MNKIQKKAQRSTDHHFILKKINTIDHHRQIKNFSTSQETIGKKTKSNKLILTKKKMIRMKKKI